MKLWIPAILILLSTNVGVAQTDPARIPIESILTVDGRVRDGLDYTGSVDVNGWNMVLDADGAPRFVRESEGKGSSLLSAPALGDECWVSGFGPSGVYGKVYVVSARGSDLYIGGLFRLAGTVLANNLVRYSTTSRAWNLVGTETSEGTSGPVYAMAWVGDDLYVGGRFNRAGTTDANGVAKWNSRTNAWSALGTGVRNDVDEWPFLVPYGGIVHALAATPEGLFVGGEFDEAGGKSIHNMARWNYDASEWTFPCRIQEEEPNGPVFALLAVDTIVYVGGSFSQLGTIQAANVASINVVGGHFQALGTGTNSVVRALAWHQGALFAGGEFTNAGGVSVQHIARWNSVAWSGLNAGLDGTVLSLASIGNALVAGGEFKRSGTLTVNGIAAWRSGEWQGLAEGMTGGTPASVAAVGAIGGWIIGGGSFTTAGTTPVTAIARWDTVRRSWGGLGDSLTGSGNGVDGNIYTMAIYNDDLYVGGDFQRIGDVSARRVARFNRTSESWSPLGSGITDPGAFVRTMAISSTGELFVGGIFNEAGGAAAVGVAKWDGSAWGPVAGGVAGPTPYVFSLSIDGTNLYAGGAFESAGGVSSPRIARLDLGSNAWSAVGGGISGDTNYAFVASVAANGSNVYAGGLFTRAGGKQVNYVAHWDGSTWNVLGTGVNAPVSVLAVYGDTLLVGGEFTKASNADIPYFARWTAGTWSSIGAAPNGPVRSITRRGGEYILGGDFSTFGATSVPFLTIGSAGGWRNLAGSPNGPVRAIVVDRGDIVIGGDFVDVGGVRANHVARFAQSGWTALGADPRIGLGGPVLAMALKNDELYVGGAFRTSGGVAVNGIARWNGTKWLTVGGGVTGGTTPFIDAIALAPNGDLYVGGQFDSAGFSPASSIARWDGIRWSPLAEGVTLNTTPGIVRSLHFDGTMLYVGGRFTRAGSTAATSLAGWNTASGTWSRVGDADVRRADDTPGEVRAIGTFDGSLFIGGAFARIGTNAISNLGEYVASSSTWSAPRGGIAQVYAIAGNNESVIVAASRIDTLRDIIGNITGFAPRYALHRFNAGTWSIFDSSAGRINALAFSPRNELYVAGKFSGIGGAASAGVARYDRGSWLSLGSGVKDIVIDTSTFGQSIGDSLYTLGDAESFALAPLADGSGTWVGGQFQIAGIYPSSYVGEWIKCGTLGVPGEPIENPAGRSRIRVAPNPARDITTLHLEFEQAGRIDVTLLGSNGEVVIATASTRVTGGESMLVIDVSSLPSGRYFCRVTRDGESFLAPIVVLR